MSKVLQSKFEGISRKLCFLIFCFMTLIAAARAEGGLVCFKKEVFLEVCPGKKRDKATLLSIAELCQA